MFKYLILLIYAALVAIAFHGAHQECLTKHDQFDSFTVDLLKQEVTAFCTEDLHPQFVKSILQVHLQRP